MALTTVSRHQDGTRGCGIGKVSRCDSGGRQGDLGGGEQEFVLQLRGGTGAGRGRVGRRCWGRGLTSNGDHHGQYGAAPHVPPDQLRNEILLLYTTENP